MSKRFFTLLVAVALVTNLWGQERKVIRLTDKTNDGIVTLKFTDATPTGELGIVQRIELECPEYTEGCWFVGDKGKDQWPAYANRILPYPFESSMSQLKYGAHFILFKLENGQFLCLLAMPSAKSMTCFSTTEDNKLRLNVATFGTAPLSGDFPVLCSARATDAYQAFSECWTKAVEHLGTTKFRHEKSYPEVFKYLGWCSWEQYHEHIDEDLLVKAITAFKNDALPIRWVLIDDGHELVAKHGKRFHKSRLRSFAPSPEKFPNAWTSIINLRSEKDVKWIGLWHSYNGYWAGLSKDNDFGPLRNSLETLPSGIYLNKPDQTSATAFYDAYMKSAKNYGFDFVKIDDQSQNILHYAGVANGVEAAQINALALQKAVKKHDLDLINCMAHNTVCFFNTIHSDITRCSIDYHVGDLTAAKSHIWQSYQNMIWLGHTVWGDHDMFHSSDANCGKLMAISKAMSGAPVYMSDAPEDMIDENIAPLCLSDGELLRPLAPGAPLPESLCIDPMKQKKAYRVIAPLSHGAAAIVAYNLVDQKTSKVTTAISANDYTEAGNLILPYAGKWEQPKEGLLLYDWHLKKARPLNGDYTITLNNFSDRLIHLLPIQNDWAVIGTTDKYLSPAAVKSIKTTPESVTIELYEVAPVTVWSGHGTLSCKGGTLVQDGNLVTCTPKGELTVVIAR